MCESHCFERTETPRERKRRKVGEGGENVGCEKESSKSGGGDVMIRGEEVGHPGWGSKTGSEGVEAEEED